jgi:hypothetical protein
VPYSVALFLYFFFPMTMFQRKDNSIISELLTPRSHN